MKQVVERFISESQKCGLDNKTTINKTIDLVASEVERRYRMAQKEFYRDLSNVKTEDLLDIIKDLREKGREL